MIDLGSRLNQSFALNGKHGLHICIFVTKKYDFFLDKQQEVILCNWKIITRLTGNRLL